MGRAVDALLRQTHREADAFRDDRTLEEYGLTVGRDVAGQDLVREIVEGLVEIGVIALRVRRDLVTDARDLAEHLAADIRQIGIDATHGIGHGHPLLLQTQPVKPADIHRRVCAPRHPHCAEACS